MKTLDQMATEVVAMFTNTQTKSPQAVLTTVQRTVHEAALAATRCPQSWLEDESYEDTAQVQHYYTVYSYMMSKVLMAAANKMSFYKEIEG